MTRDGQADGGPRDTAPASRPDGPLIWLHRSPLSDVDALLALAARFHGTDWDVTWIVTGDGPPLPAPLVSVQTPPETTPGARSFLDFWRPDLVVWMQGGFLGNLIQEVDQRGIARLLVDAEAGDLALARSGWLGGLRRNVVRGFRHALAVDDDAADRLRRLGLEGERIEVAGRLEEGALTLPASETQRTRLAAELQGRPVWFVPGAQRNEVAAIAAAQVEAMRRSPRLMVAVMPADSSAGPDFAAAFHEVGLRTILRSTGEAPSEDCEVVVADREDELGLWYRLSPVTFMGGTLGDGGNGRSPFEPASLGSAILHGPRTRPWAQPYRRLGRAGATRCIHRAQDLGAQVTVFLSPDRAATMAHAGWETVSTNAWVTNRLIELVEDSLDRAGV